MMKKFSLEEISSQNVAKSSAHRAIRAQILKQYPRLEHVIDDIIPKKTPLTLVKCQRHITMIANGKQILFFQSRDGPWVPTLRLLHTYPSMMPKMQVDRGAISFVLRGSNIMCPGLTSPGGRMENVEAGDVVQVTAEGKLNACAIGIATMSTKQILQDNKGICIESYTYLNDGLWQVPELD
ncbi:cell cycle regulator protein [Toxoplasma gondii TgCatPRC2]|uniref:Cell cycle regulator protein n=13 Tax=Toxoplasma gondii TaxID=5811 RepID=B9PYL7_TOXGV|nr:cell cycle regulator protein [Toxoplasma gondii GT1]ESS30131.1 cell cycle regulator protein [Toxoplasma gondii VEG]KAF4645569.1 cell cycle regulator protein [Toxoplasma gondii]KFG36410.1 cell cycle regulator protein [Toxoplasma gondii p89]KFG41481.1 cell cycle regulator protein [Toxoplasma gondii GAB2-2007-GAL-DOM2]KFG47419.1 cell cycle regulator protein [Toxoplasma gondii FOU]KFG61081.1 cell cycle regulator protein [Toxoplasma gondii RUB]KFH03692.1 cell cycle regulator protein [Toxoplasm